MIIEFFIPGIAKPGGSKTATLIRRGDGSPVMIPTKSGGSRPLITTRDASKNGDWKSACKFFARQEFVGEPLNGPIRLDVIFYIRRPKSHYKAGDPLRGLKAALPSHPLKDPDRTKLLRCLEDALTSILWRDDNLIVAGELRKEWAGKDGPGALVRAELIQ